MKNTLCFLIVLSTVLCAKAKMSGCGIVKIVICKTNMTIMTPTNVRCEEFGEVGFDIDTFIISDKSQIQKLSKIITSSRPAPEYHNSIDIRAKVMLYYKSRNVDVLCFGSGTRFLLNGVSFNENKGRLRDFLFSLNRGIKP